MDQYTHQQGRFDCECGHKMCADKPGEIKCFACDRRYSAEPSQEFKISRLAPTDAERIMFLEREMAELRGLDWYNDLATVRALRRIGELHEELLAWLGGRSILMDRDQRSVNRGALTHAAIEHWFLQHDIRCRIRLDPGGIIGFDSARLVT